MALDRIALAPLAEENGFAVMLFDLLRQNLDAKPHKLKDFDAITANVAIVVEDADVALPLCFGGGRLTIRNGIAGVPDATIRGDADSIIGMSSMIYTNPLSKSTELANSIAERSGEDYVWQDQIGGYAAISIIAAALEQAGSANPEDINKAWRDTGLYDEDGDARPVLDVWKTYLARPVR